MDGSEALRRIRALWEGDAVQDVTLLWRMLTRDSNDDVEQLVEAIAAAGRRDPGVAVEPDTLDEMRTIARLAG